MFTRAELEFLHDLYAELGVVDSVVFVGVGCLLLLLRANTAAVSARRYGHALRRSRHTVVVNAVGSVHVFAGRSLRTELLQTENTKRKLINYRFGQTAERPEKACTKNDINVSM